MHATAVACILWAGLHSSIVIFTILVHMFILLREQRRSESQKRSNRLQDVLFHGMKSHSLWKREAQLTVCPTSCTNATRSEYTGMPFAAIGWNEFSDSFSVLSLLHPSCPLGYTIIESRHSHMLNTLTTNSSKLRRVAWQHDCQPS